MNITFLVLVELLHNKHLAVYPNHFNVGVHTYKGSGTMLEYPFRLLDHSTKPLVKPKGRNHYDTEYDIHDYQHKFILRVHHNKNRASVHFSINDTCPRCLSLMSNDYLPRLETTRLLSAQGLAQHGRMVHTTADLQNIRCEANPEWKMLIHCVTQAEAAISILSPGVQFSLVV